MAAASGLDPQARALLAQMQAAGMPPLHAVPPAELRRLMAAARRPIVPPEPVARVEEMSLPGPEGAIPVRLYAPEGARPLPGLIYMHGGGWVIGSVETSDPLCRLLASRAGCAVVSVGYRLAPEHRFPAAVEDSYAAARWVADNAPALGLDPHRLAVGGDSAGGNLATVVAMLARERGGPPLVFQLLVYPATDCRFDTPSYRENGSGYTLTADEMRWFWQQYLRDERDAASPCASPLRAADLSGMPPALVLTAEFDPLRDEGEAYAARLRAHGVPVTLHRYAGMMHGFFARSDVLDKGRTAVDEAARALRGALGNRAG